MANAKDSTRTITAADPNALNAAAAAVMEAANAAAEDDNEIDDLADKALELPETVIELPGGYVNADLELVTEVEIRELTGADEEAIAKSADAGRALLTILERGTVRVGEEKAARNILDSMLIGDRDYVLLAIRRATYGNEVELTEVNCQNCGGMQELTVDLSTDVPIARWDDPENDRYFEVKSRGRVFQVSMPVGQTQRELITKGEITLAEMNTILLAGAVNSIDGVPSMGVSTVRNLGIADREAITREIAKRYTGPRLNATEKECPSCGEKIVISLAMGALFRL